MRHTLRSIILGCALAVAGTLGTAHAQESSSKPMTTQFGVGVLLGLSDFGYTGGEFRGFIPISTVEGLRVVPALSFAVHNDFEHQFLATADLDLAYTPYRFGGRNGGAYVKAGLRYDVGFNTDIENSTDGSLGGNLGVGIQGSLGPIDLYGEFGHLFVEGPGSNNQIIIGLTVAAQ